jgi:hypothetical protein
MLQMEGRHLLCSMTLDEMSIRELIELKGNLDFRISIHNLTVYCRQCTMLYR